MTKSGSRLSHLGMACICLALLAARVEAAPTAAVSASPTSGNAPLGIFFDGSNSSADSVSFLWNFGDGSASTAKTLTHVYIVAGTYVATLTVTDAGGATSQSSITITVAGLGEGPVTDNMNFRLALQGGTFGLRHTVLEKDSTTLTFALNLVDLPNSLQGLAASFSVNGAFTINGVFGPEDGIQNGEHRKPEFDIQISQRDQRMSVFIGKANLKAAFAASGAGNITTTSNGVLVPITFTLTIGAQTYTLTENFLYHSTQDATGRGEFNYKKQTGTIRDGFFVVNSASALENDGSTGHYFTFDTLLSRPMQKLLQAPGSGSFRVTLNDADTEVILFDRFKVKSGKITYAQGDRGLSGTRQMVIDVSNRKLSLRTWDIKSRVSLGGTGLPLRGQNFTAFNFTIRMEFDQPDGTTFEVVTATRMTRKSEDDALWQSGRRKSAGP